MGNEYVERMEQAMMHKRYFIDIIYELEHKFLQQDILAYVFEKYPQSKAQILDFGCGSGLLTAKIAEAFPYMEVLGYDSSLDMVEIARERAERDNLTFTSSADVLEDRKYNFIVLSSVLHEIYSKTGNTATVTKFFNYLKNLLLPGGFIISRDNYIERSDDETEVEAKFYNEAEMRKAIFFLDKLRFMAPSHLSHHYRNLHINEKKEMLIGSERAVKELLNKMTWGEESLPRESQESLFCFDDTDWELMVPNDYTIVDFYHYTDTEYLGRYLRWIVEINDFYPTHRWTLLQLNT